MWVTRKKKETQLDCVMKRPLTSGNLALSEAANPSLLVAAMVKERF